MRQQVGASVPVSPWWRAAPQGGVRHEVPKNADARLCLLSCDRVSWGFRSVGSTPFWRCWYPCSIAGGFSSGVLIHHVRRVPTACLSAFTSGTQDDVLYVWVATIAVCTTIEFPLSMYCGVVQWTQC